MTITFHYMGKDSDEVLGWNDRDHVEEVTFDTSITTIGNDAFSWCTNLTSIEIPSHITSIEKYAFYNCTSLTAIIIPPSVTTIGVGAFAKCTSLQKVTISPSNTTMDFYAFEGCTELDEQSLKDINDCFPKIQTQDAFQNKQAPMPKYNFQGSTQNGWGPEWWGITLEQMESIMIHPLIRYDTLMRDVVRLAVKPATKQCGVGYSLLLNQHKPLHAKVMVSVSIVELHLILIGIISRFFF